jgi:uncharacterized protein YdbL (DUF1318 family)
MRKPILVATITALLLTLACVTVNVYFPAAEVQSAADKIVEEVHGKEASSTESGNTSSQSMLRRMLRGMSPFERKAYAQVDVDVSTPNIRALKESMKERFKSLRPLYEAGVMGEDNGGLLSIRSLEGLSLKEKADANKLLKAENSDRQALYSEIAKANSLPSDTVSQISKLFANSWRKEAEKGWWIQRDNGDWVRKDSE